MISLTVSFTMALNSGFLKGLCQTEINSHLHTTVNQALCHRTKLHWTGVYHVGN